MKAEDIVVLPFICITIRALRVPSVHQSGGWRGMNPSSYITAASCYLARRLRRP